MSMFADIDTNPQALRMVAEQIKQYSLNQMYIIENYYYKMRALQDDIETERYKEIIDEIERSKLRFEDIHQLSVLVFAAFLVRKAELLESAQASNSGISIAPPTSSSHYPRPSVSSSSAYDYGSGTSTFNPVGSSTLLRSAGNYGAYVYSASGVGAYEGCFSQPITSYKAYSDFDKSAFRNGEYQSYIATEDIKAYRYFGSYDSPGKKHLKNGNYSRSPYEANAHKVEGWGSDAAGRWASVFCSNDIDYVRNALAMNPDWGNDGAFVCEMIIPKGTLISIGVTEKQGDLDGGQLQLFIHGKYDDVINNPNGIGAPDSAEREENDKKLFGEMLKSWIKRCGPIESFDFQQSTQNDNETNNE